MISAMGADIIRDPAAAKQRLLTAFEEAEGDRKKTAATLGGTERTLYRWIGRLGAWDDLDAIAERRGFERVPGPPRMGDRITSALVGARGSVRRAAKDLGFDPEELRKKLDELHLLGRVNGALKAAGYPEIREEAG